MRRLVVLALSLLPLTAHAAVAPATLNFADSAGNWRGFITRQDTGNRHAVGLTLKDSAVEGKVAGSISYPGLGCGGQLIAVATDGDTIIVREKLKFGLDRCKPDTLLYLTPVNKNTLNFVFHTASTTLNTHATDADINGQGDLTRAR